MGKVIHLDGTEISNAVRAWIGWGGVIPKRDEVQLTRHLGAERAKALLPVVKRLEQDFYASDARFVARDLEEMALLAKEHFALMHPNIPAEVGEAFAWCYTFDFK